MLLPVTAVADNDDDEVDELVTSLGDAPLVPEVMVDDGTLFAADDDAVLDFNGGDVGDTSVRPAVNDPEFTFFSSNLSCI